MSPSTDLFGREGRASLNLTSLSGTVARDLSLADSASANTVPRPARLECPAFALERLMKQAALAHYGPEACRVSSARPISNKQLEISYFGAGSHERLGKGWEGVNGGCNIGGFRAKGDG